MAKSSEVFFMVSWKDQVPLLKTLLWKDFFFLIDTKHLRSGQQAERALDGVERHFYVGVGRLAGKAVFI
jgi:hypothetical protein